MMVLVFALVMGNLCASITNFNAITNLVNVYDEHNDDDKRENDRFDQELNKPHKPGQR